MINATLLSAEYKRIRPALLVAALKLTASYPNATEEAEDLVCQTIQTSINISDRYDETMPLANWLFGVLYQQSRTWRQRWRREMARRVDNEAAWLELALTCEDHEDYLQAVEVRAQLRKRLALADLTDRQREVIAGLADGLSFTLIAKKLSISRQAVTEHFLAARKKILTLPDDLVTDEDVGWLYLFRLCAQVPLKRQGPSLGSRLAREKLAKWDTIAWK